MGNSLPDARFLDDLARTLAQPMPRRRALRLVGTSLAAVLVSGVGPRVARSGTFSRSITCPPDRRRCQHDHDGDYRTPDKEYCCEGPTSQFECGPLSGPGAGKCENRCPPFNAVLNRSQYPCIAEKPQAPPGTPGERATWKLGQCCIRPEYKGCNPDGTCKPNCPRDQVECGKTCCPPGMECKQGRCVVASRCGGVRCPTGQECCAGTQLMPKARCYDPDTQCCTPIKGVVPKRPMTKLAWCPDRQPKKNHTPRANGCGSEGGLLTAIIPNRFLRADFKSACDFHDICYETCRKNKGFCDRRFRTLMEAECRNVYAIGIGRRVCLDRAQVYYLAVSKGGDDAYEAAQRDACNCC